MRIITGQLKGRIYDAPRGHHTHPMGDKVKGALFNTLGDITGLTVLDAYSGSGALSFEAISRGAISALAIDDDKEAYQTITANCEKLGVKDRVTPMRKNISGWTRNNQHKQFDIVIADPPYDQIDPTVLKKLIQQVMIGGIYVLSWPSSEPIREFAQLEALTSKKHAGAQLVFYRKTG